MSFPIPRPRGKDMPSAKPLRKTSQPITTKGTTRVMNARGLWQATLAPSHRSISIEAESRAGPAPISAPSSPEGWFRPNP